MEYYSARKRKEALMHATTLRNLEKLCNMKEARHKRPYIIWFHLYEISRIGKSEKTEGRLADAGGWGKGRMESDCLTGTVLLWGDDAFWKQRWWLHTIMNLAHWERIKCHWLVHFEMVNSVMWISSEFLKVCIQPRQPARNCGLPHNRHLPSSPCQELPCHHKVCLVLSDLTVWKRMKIQIFI